MIKPEPPEPAMPEVDRLPWRAVGVELGAGNEDWYVFEVEGRIRKIRSVMIASTPAIMSIDRDAARWRRMFPGSRMGMDKAAIAGFLIAECWAAQDRIDLAKKANADPGASSGD